MSSAARKNDSTTNDPATARAAPARAPTTNPPARTVGQKVRDCCQSCGKSKVRCTKEKPSCSRCETKGIPCRYLQSRRPGRIPGSGARRLNPAMHSTTDRSMSRAGADASSLTTPPPRDNNGIPHRPTGDTTDDAATTSLSPTLTALDNTAPDDIRFRADPLFEAYYGAADALGSNVSSDLDLEGDSNVPFIWDDCLGVLANIDDPMYASLMDWDTTKNALTADLGSVAQSPTNWLPMASHAPSASIMSTETSSQASPFTLPSSSSSASLVSSSSDPVSLSTRNTSPAATSIGRRQPTFNHSAPVLDQSLKTSTSSSCSCLDKALDLLKEVNKDPCPDPSETGCATTQTILAKNKEYIQATLVTLACVSCMEDRLLIMISLLITMKILPRYASAAALTGSPTSPSDEARGISRHDNASLSTRQAKQQVLRELHLVQRLISQLSSRLKGLACPRRDSTSAAGLLEPRPILKQAESSASIKMSRMRNNSLQSASSETDLMPISTRTLDLVEDDVRNSLSSLSAVVRNALKEI